MEYFIYDYKNVNSNLEFTAYDKFITNFKIYKYYLFDLTLLKCDSKTDEVTRTNSNSIITRQKILFLLPYPIVMLSFLYLYKTNVFKAKLFSKEIQTVKKLFGLIFVTRIFQKGLLKYEGDKVLIEVSKNKNHTV